MAFSVREESTTDAAKLYLHEIAHHKLLTIEEEIGLARRLEQGRAARAELVALDESLDPALRLELQHKIDDGEKARCNLIESNLRLVVLLATRYFNRGLSFLDLVEEGNIGLSMAVDKFDWRRGARLGTYARWWILKAMMRWLSDQSRTIRLPARVVGLLSSAVRAESEIQTATGEVPTVEAVAQCLGVDVGGVDEALCAARRPRSLDSPMIEDSDTLWGDLLGDEAAGQAAQHEVERQELSKRLADALDRLDPREREILEMHFGLEGGEERNIDEIAQAVGLSCERTRQIERVALSKLRRMPGLRDEVLEYVVA